jgi:hypothetical protein
MGMHVLAFDEGEAQVALDQFVGHSSEFSEWHTSMVVIVEP